MSIDPPYRLDPFQNIVNVSWENARRVVGVYAWFEPFTPMAWPYPVNSRVHLDSDDPLGKSWADITGDEFLGITTNEQRFAIFQDFGVPPYTAWEPIWNATPQKIGLSAKLELFGCHGLQRTASIWSRTFDVSGWTIQDEDYNIWVTDYCLSPSPYSPGWWRYGNFGPGTSFLAVFKPQVTA